MVVAMAHFTQAQTSFVPLEEVWPFDTTEPSCPLLNKDIPICSQADLMRLQTPSKAGQISSWAVQNLVHIQPQADQWSLSINSIDG